MIFDIQLGRTLGGWHYRVDQGGKFIGASNGVQPFDVAFEAMKADVHFAEQRLSQPADAETAKQKHERELEAVAAIMKEATNPTGYRMGTLKPADWRRDGDDIPAETDARR